MAIPEKNLDGYGLPMVVAERVYGPNNLKGDKRMLASRLMVHYTWPQGTLAASETQAQRMNTFDQVKTIVSHALQLGNRGAHFNAASPLLGAIPELDSMAVVNVITALEEHFGFYVEDDEIGADTFETLGSLANFVNQKLRD